MEKITEIGKALRQKSSEKAKQLEEEYQEILEKLEQNLIKSSHNKLTQIESSTNKKLEDMLERIEQNIHIKIEKSMKDIESQMMQKLLLMEAQEKEHYQLIRLRQQVILESLGTTLTFKKNEEGKIVIKEKKLKKKFFGGN